jgi:hypothetical protein
MSVSSLKQSILNLSPHAVLLGKEFDNALLGRAEVKNIDTLPVYSYPLLLDILYQKYRNIETAKDSLVMDIMNKYKGRIIFVHTEELEVSPSDIHG